jgi:hypothetical protein
MRTYWTAHGSPLQDFAQYLGQVAGASIIGHVYPDTRPSWWWLYSGVVKGLEAQGGAAQ